MATPKQIAANRRNAQKSTGPQSPEAKAKVSQNAVQHGLCGQFHVLPEVERQEDFDHFFNQLVADEKPVGAAELELVLKMARHTWLSQRAARMQEMSFILEPKTAEDLKTGAIPVHVDEHLERSLRYQTTHDRAYHRASAELQKRKKARQLVEIGIARQKAEEELRALKAEKLKLDIASKKARKQLDEIKVAKQLAAILPPDLAHSASGARCARSSFAPSALNSPLNPPFAAAAPHASRR